MKTIALLIYFLSLDEFVSKNILWAGDRRCKTHCNYNCTKPKTIFTHLPSSGVTRGWFEPGGKT